MPRSSGIARTSSGRVPLHHGHVLLFDGIGGGTWRQRLLADGAHRHFQKIRQHVVALAVMGQALKGLDELLSEFGRRRHAWSFLPVCRGA